MRLGTNLAFVLCLVSCALLSSACGPERFALELPVEATTRAMILAVERRLPTGAVVLTALIAIDPGDTSEEAAGSLQALWVPDDDPSFQMTLTALGYTEPLDALGLAPGELKIAGLGETGRVLPTARAIYEVVIEASSRGDKDWTPLPELGARLRTVRIADRKSG